MKTYWLVMTGAGLTMLLAGCVMMPLPPLPNPAATRCLDLSATGLR